MGRDGVVWGGVDSKKGGKGVMVANTLSKLLRISSFHTHGLLINQLIIRAWC